ncbi:MAG: hypothetical protein HYZ83_07380 [Candidatus Omnitrophica bacterium]|nr:hypothetical protein [Candidatus Omnitrophota bacterium]
MDKKKHLFPKKYLSGIAIGLLFLSVFCVPSVYAQDNIGLIFRGVARLVGTAFQVPATILRDSITGFPFGVIGGAVNGSFQAVSGVLSGGMDIARGSAPYAKYAALAL